MSEREARALGAGISITVKDKDYVLSPVSIQKLSVLQREALQAYKREYLETYANNLSLLGSRAQLVLDQKMEEAAKWDIKDLPPKKAYSAKRVPITDVVKEKIKELFDHEPTEDDRWRDLLTTALDQQQITPEWVFKETGEMPEMGLISYDQWWVTGRLEGLIAFVHASVNETDPTIPRSLIGKWHPADLIYASRRVELLTTPAVGNT